MTDISEALQGQLAAHARVDAARAKLNAASPGSQAGRLTDGDVTINTGALDIAGWTDVRISGGLDRMPATFDLGMTETYPGAVAHNQLQAGQGCRIRIGGDTVIVGWINRVIRSLSPNGHTMRVQGRSRCQDLVDCSAMLPNMSINSVSIGDLARQLIAPFAGPIQLQLPDGNGAGKAYQFSVSLGQTPYELIAQVAAYEGLLVHDDAAGDLVICKVGTTSFASGFREGENLEAWTVTQSDEALFSRYVPVLMAQDSLAQTGADGNKAGAQVPDPLVKRERPLIVVSDQMIQDEFLAQTRAVWEATRRRGRSRSVSLVCDSWRDAAGRLWTHNVLAPVHLPSCSLVDATWLLTEWELVRDAQGTHANITLMPPEAFAVEPSALNGTNYQIAQAVRANAIGTAVNTTGGSALSAPNAAAGENVRAGDGYGL